MKSKLGILGLLLVSTMGWAASDREVQFVATLSSAVGSFKEISTEDPSVVTDLSGVEVSFGVADSQEDSDTKSYININAGQKNQAGEDQALFEIEELAMEDNTKLNFGSRMWVIEKTSVLPESGTLSIGVGGSVNPFIMHVEELVLSNGELTQKLVNEGSLYVGSPLTTQMLEAGSVTTDQEEEVSLFRQMGADTTAHFVKFAPNSQTTRHGLQPRGFPLEIAQ